MASEKTAAIVVRVVDYSETSCIVTLFTRDFGKIGVLAKGARRNKSPFDSAIDLLTVCRIVFIHKSSDALDLLTEAKMERRFRAATRDLSCLYAGYYVAELLRELTDFGDPHPDIFDKADQTLADLEGDICIRSTIARFEVAMLRMLGYLPSLDKCVTCGKLVSSAGRVLFGQLAGGVLCQGCRGGQRQVVSMNGDVLELLRQMADSNRDRRSESHLRQGVWGELRGVLNHYLANLLGHQPRMHKYLGSLSN